MSFTCFLVYAAKYNKPNGASYPSPLRKGLKNRSFILFPNLSSFLKLSILLLKTPFIWADKALFCIFLHFTIDLTKLFTSIFPAQLFSHHSYIFLYFLVEF